MQVRSEENKKLFAVRKKEIQEKFRSEMGLLMLFFKVLFIVY